MGKYSLSKIFFILFFSCYLILPEYFALELSQGLPLITGSRIILVCCVLLCFAKKKFKFNACFCKDKNLNKTLNIYIVGMILINILNFTKAPSATIKELLTIVLEEYLLCWVIVSEINTKRKLRSALELIVYASGVVAIISLIGTISGQNLFYYINTVSRTMLQSAFVRSGFLRAEAGFGHAVYYGMYCVVIIPIAAYLYENVETHKNWFLICLFLNIMAVFLSNSRGSLIVAIPLCLYIFLKGKKGLSKKYIKIIIATCGLCILAVIINSSIRNLIINIIQSLYAIINKNIVLTNYGENAEGMSSRLAQLSSIWYVLRYHPIIGFGADVLSRGVCLVYWIDSWIPLTTLDMGFIGTITQFGFLGFFIEICLFYNLVKKSYRNKNKNNIHKMFLLCFISYLLCLLSVSRLRDTLWMVIGLYMASINIEECEKNVECIR